MIMNMNGGLSLYAVIAVTYPAGSICTCGGKAARDTSGYALFPVKAGTYAVECHTVDNSKSKSTSVTVVESDKGKSISVGLSYELFLFNSGSLASGYSLDTYAISPAVDVTNYSVMSVTGKITWMNYILTAYVGLSETPEGEFAARAGFSNMNETTVDVDISALSGLYYFSTENAELSITDGILILNNSNYRVAISQIKFS